MTKQYTVTKQQLAVECTFVIYLVWCVWEIYTGNLFGITELGKVSGGITIIWAGFLGRVFMLSTLKLFGYKVCLSGVDVKD